MRGCLLILIAIGSLADAQSFDARFEEIRKAATAREMYSFFWDMPKGGDIHHHMSLSFRPQEVFDALPNYYTRLGLSNCPSDNAPPLRYRVIAKATLDKLSACEQADYVQMSKLDGEQKAAWVSAMILDKPGEGRNEFFEVVVARLAEPARDPAFVLEVLPKMLKRYDREKVLYVESQFNAASPEAVAKIRERLAQPDLKTLATTIRFQYVVIRFLPNAEQAVERAYSFVDQNRDLWVGINMAGREDNTKGHALRFLDVYRKMRRTYSGIHLSIHGGEVDNPGHEVRNTLLIGAERIGHGVNLITDPDTMLLMRGGRNLVECNLVSNRLLEYTPDLATHPFIEYLRFGIPVCLNTDDSGIWDSNLTDEYVLASQYYKLTWTEIVQIGRNSLLYSFAQPELKKQLLERFDRNVREFEQKYAAGDWRDALQRVQPEISGHAKRAILRD